MKTLKDYMEDHKVYGMEEIWKEIITEILSDYLKEDRKNVAEHAHICLRKYDSIGVFTENDYGQEVTTEREDEYWGIYEDSIINTPQIELK